MGSRDRLGDVRRLVAAHMLEYQIASIDVAGEGLDHTAYVVNDELIVRVEKQAGSGTADARLLAAVAAISPVPVPEVVFAEADCLAYRKLPGVPLLDVPSARRAACATAIAARLGELLAALHGAPVAAMAELVDEDDEPLDRWQRDAARAYRAAVGEIPAVHRRPIEAFLGSTPADGGYPRVFSHNDLGIEHVLVDPDAREVTGVIDWSDAAITDPAHDFGLILRDLGPAALEAAIEAYGAGVDRERAAFHARCMLLEDLAYGLETGRRAYVDKSLAGMAWLFPLS
jgi:aminoglycoside phosphotransferase (APT) family kinase protein